MKDCIFCQIVTGKLPSTKVYEDKGILAFKSIAPVASVHLLIIPKKHLASFIDLKEDSYRILNKMTKVAQRLIKSQKVGGGYKLVFNGGKYQAIEHLHWHLLGGKWADKSDIVNKT